MFLKEDNGEQKNHLQVIAINKVETPLNNNHLTSIKIL
jgi:hypothetical protein